MNKINSTSRENLPQCAQLNIFSSNDKQKIYSWLIVKNNLEISFVKSNRQIPKKCKDEEKIETNFNLV